MHIVLYQPQIPQNTGNIIRTCVATNTKLTLIEPIAFNTDTKSLRRAGLDYIKDFTIHKSNSLEDILKDADEVYFFSSKCEKRYDKVNYSSNVTLVFGSETSGLDSWIHEKYAAQYVNIPISKKSRCLNLSNAVNIALYEALRQQDFATI
jgi:tRNA (cytidine/uridine-2'-O-)-methyltransferase